MKGTINKNKKLRGVVKKLIIGFVSLLFGLVMTIFTNKILNFRSDVYVINFSSNDLQKEVDQIISENEYKDFDEFSNQFANNTKEKLLKLKKDSENISGQELMQIYYVLKDKFPNHNIKLQISNEADREDRWVFSAIIFLLSSFFGYVFQYIITNNIDFKEQVNKILGDWFVNDDNPIKTWTKDQKNDLSHIIESKFTNTIETFANTHEGFIKGIYDNYPHNFTRIFDSNDNSKVYGEINKGRRGLYIWMDNIGTSTYSDFAIELLKRTEKSVFSTTYYDNNQLIKNLNNSKGKVVLWLKQVNRKKIDNNLKIFRVHMFNNNSSRKLKSFIKILKKNANALENYIEQYIESADFYFTYKITGDNKNFPKFYGEYIIFDNQIMIKYDEDLKILELYIGQVVDAFVKNFNESSSFFKNSYNNKKMINILRNTND